MVHVVGTRLAETLYDVQSGYPWVLGSLVAGGWSGIVRQFSLPLVVWMMHSYMTEIPGAIYEAAKVDGASVAQEFFRIALPLSRTMPRLNSVSGTYTRVDRLCRRMTPKR